MLTAERYAEAENAYVRAVLGFLHESGTASLTVGSLESHGNSGDAVFEGERVTGSRIEHVIRSVLREKYWCRLAAANGFLHFGYDYSLYVGVPGPCPDSVQLAIRSGLFVERMRSPYHASTALE